MGPGSPRTADRPAPFALQRPLAADEARADVLDLLLGHADPGVLACRRRRAAGTLTDPPGSVYLTALETRVVDHLPDAGGRRRKRQERRGGARPARGLRNRPGVWVVQPVADESGEVSVLAVQLQAALPGLRDIEEAGHEQLQASGVPVDDVEMGAHRVGEVVAVAQDSRREHPGQRGAQFVGLDATDSSFHLECAGR